MTSTTAVKDTINSTTASRAHLSYLDCLKGKANIPQDKLGKTVFQTLMVGGMVTFMGIFNGIQHNGIGFLPHGLWMLPLIFCIAYLVRSFIGNPVVNFLVPRLVFGKFSKVITGILMTLLNVAVMSPIMSGIVTVLLTGIDALPYNWLANLPMSFVMGATVNFFIVGPIVKMTWANHFAEGGNAQLLQFIQRYAMPWAAFLND